MANAKGIGIGVVVALACAGAAYGVGRFQGSEKVHDAEARASAAASQSASAVGSTRVALDIERGKVARLEGRRRLHLAIIAMEDRNFGIADENLAAARKNLAGAAGGDPELAKVATDLEGLKIVATDDIGEQRKKLLDLCRRIDNLLPPQ
jgi:hypothetical protein